MQTACEQPDTPGVLVNDGEPMYIFWLWRAGESAPTPPRAAVMLRCKAGSQTEQRTVAFVHALVRTALEILARELMNREQIQRLPERDPLPRDGHVHLIFAQEDLTDHLSLGQ